MKIAAIVLIIFFSGCAHPVGMERTDSFKVILQQRWDAPWLCTMLIGSFHEACAMPYTPKGCKIFISPDAESEVWRHEFKHCFLGDYHGK